MTHRLRAAQLADRVVVLDAGRVVEQGRHEDLVGARGLYARLWRGPQLAEEVAPARRRARVSPSARSCPRTATPGPPLGRGAASPVAHPRLSPAPSPPLRGGAS